MRASDTAREFDRLAPFWDNGPGSLNHLTLQMRSAYLRDLCASYRRARLLDVGCGTGQQLVALADCFEAGIGIDISPAMIERARIKAGERGLASRLNFHVLPAEDVCRKRLGTFDVVLFVGSLEHISDAHLSLIRATDVLQPAGAVVLVMVHPWHPRSFYARFAARGGAIPRFRHFTPGALRGCAGSAGLHSADPFGPDCLRQANKLGRLKHRILNGLVTPAARGSYVAVFYPASSET